MLNIGNTGEKKEKGISQVNEIGAEMTDRWPTAGHL